MELFAKPRHLSRKDGSEGFDVQAITVEYVDARIDMFLGLKELDSEVIIRIIRGSTSIDGAKRTLMDDLHLTDTQAEFILELPLTGFPVYFNSSRCETEVSWLKELKALLLKRDKDLKY